MAYLRVAKDSKYSFLLESVIGGENVARYSFIGAGTLQQHRGFSQMLIGVTLDPFKVIKTGPAEDITGDPMAVLQKELSLLPIRENSRDSDIHWRGL